MKTRIPQGEIYNQPWINHFSPHTQNSEDKCGNDKMGPNSLTSQFPTAEVLKWGLVGRIKSITTT